MMEPIRRALDYSSSHPEVMFSGLAVPVVLWFWKQISRFAFVAKAHVTKQAQKLWRALQHFRNRPTRKELLASLGQSLTVVSQLQERIALLEDQHALAETTRQAQLLNQQPQENVVPNQPEIARLPGLQEKLLIAAAEGLIFRDSLHRLAGIHLAESRFHLQELYEHRFIDYEDPSIPSFKIKQEGVRYLLSHNLMPLPKPQFARRTAGGMSPRAATAADFKHRRINPAPGR